MIVNTCTTSKSFNNEYWMKIFNLIHEDIKLDITPPKKPEKFENLEIPVPMLIWKYWMLLWKKKGNIGKEFLNASNMDVVDLQKIWEYTQVIASISFILNNNIQNKKIISLGAGVEGPLFVFDKLGGNVYASDIYNTPHYPQPHLVKYIKSDPELFCHYKNYKPNIKFINIDLKSKKDIKSLGYFDVIYSISVLEHIYSNFPKKKKLFKNLVKHINSDGVFSFTTELLIKYDNKRIYKHLIQRFLRKIKYIIISPKSKGTPTQNNNFREESSVFSMNNNRNKGIKHMIIKSLKKIFHLHQYNRRYDFFTVEEILILIKTLKKEGMILIGNIDWSTLNEHPIKSQVWQQQYHTHISLTFRKSS